MAARLGPLQGCGVLTAPFSSAAGSGPAVLVACSAGWAAWQGFGGGGVQPLECDGHQPGANVVLLGWVDWVWGAAA